MTHKQRMLCAMRRQAVDCIPHATYNFHPYWENQHTEDSSYAEMLERVRATGGDHSQKTKGMVMLSAATLQQRQDAIRHGCL